MNKSFFKFKMNLLFLVFLVCWLQMKLWMLSYIELFKFVIYGNIIIMVIIGIFGRFAVKCEQCGRNQFDYEMMRAMKKTKTDEWLPNECLCGIHRYDFFEGLDVILHKNKHTLNHKDNKQEEPDKTNNEL